MLLSTIALLAVLTNSSSPTGRNVDDRRACGRMRKRGRGSFIWERSLGAQASCLHAFAKGYFNSIGAHSKVMQAGCLRSQRGGVTKRPCSGEQGRYYAPDLSLKPLNGFRLGSLRSLNYVELNTLALLERFVTLFLYCRVVHEHIGAARLLDEPVPLCVTEPLDLAL